MSDDDMVMSTWTIYDSPSDYPDLFVVRRWEIRHGYEPVPTDDVRTASSLAQARRNVPGGCVRFHRSPGDDPTIVETWM